MILHGYFRSAASWRVRIALNLKRVAVQQAFHHLRRGEQRSSEYLALNPQGLVPTLEMEDGTPLTQSLAIIEWLDEVYPDPPLLPGDATQRAAVRAFALTLAADTHPLQNLGVLNSLRSLGLAEAEVTRWAAEANSAGLAACEALLAREAGPFCFGSAPSRHYSREMRDQSQAFDTVHNYANGLFDEVFCNEISGPGVWWPGPISGGPMNYSG